MLKGWAMNADLGPVARLTFLSNDPKNDHHKAGK